MTKDLRLSNIDIPAGARRRLEKLEIRGVRQLFARLQREAGDLQPYLGLSDEDFAALRHTVEAMIDAQYPQDKLPHLHPAVNKKGVAVDRLDDPERPRYAARSGSGRHR